MLCLWKRFGLEKLGVKEFANFAQDFSPPNLCKRGGTSVGESRKKVQVNQDSADSAQLSQQITHNPHNPIYTLSRTPGSQNR